MYHRKQNQARVEKSTVGGVGIMLYYRSDFCYGTDHYLFIMASNIISGSFIQYSEEKRTEKVTQKIPISIGVMLNDTSLRLGP